MSEFSLVILISGRGSNMQAILEKTARGELAVEVRAVISNNARAAGLATAAAAGVETRVLDHRGFADRAAYDRALQAEIERYAPDLVVLAGFMRILSADFVRHFEGRLINIHPSLLPAFRGLDTHARALAAGVREHGASVHFVTEELDGGPVIAQMRVPVEPDDTVERLAARVLDAEHRLYPTVVGWFSEGRLRYRSGVAYLDGSPLDAPRQLGAGKTET